MNFITRKNFDGNETRLRYGVATEGSPDNYQAQHTVGRHGIQATSCCRPILASLGAPNQ